MTLCSLNCALHSRSDLGSGHDIPECLDSFLGENNKNTKLHVYGD